MADPIVALLSKQSASRLMEMRNAAVEQINDLQQQLTWIDRAILEKGGDQSVAAHVADRKVGRRKSGKRDAIAGILNSRELGRAWTPAEVRDALRELHGIDSTVEAVRVTLRRMFEAGEVERGGPNGTGWRLPSHEATVEAPVDEPRSANGYAPEGVLALIDGSEQPRSRSADE